MTLLLDTVTLCALSVFCSGVYNYNYNYTISVSISQQSRKQNAVAIVAWSTILLLESQL